MSDIPNEAGVDGPSFDPQAPRVGLVATRLGSADLGNVLDGADFLGFSSQDIDAEAWYVTRAGQLVRTVDDDLHYVYDNNDYDVIDMLIAMSDGDEAILSKVWTPDQIHLYASSQRTP